MIERTASFGTPNIVTLRHTYSIKSPHFFCFFVTALRLTLDSVLDNKA